MAKFDEAIRYARRLAIRRGVRYRVFGRRDICMCRRVRNERGQRLVHYGYVGWEYYVKEAK